MKKNPSMRKMNSSRDHSIYRTPQLEFIPLPPPTLLSSSFTPPDQGELILWRFRADPHVRKRRETRETLNSLNHACCRRFPNAAQNKLYVASRLALVQILANMLECSPDQLMLQEDSEHQPKLNSPAAGKMLSIRIAFAGIWIVIAISRSELGIAAGLPIGDSVNGARSAELMSGRRRRLPFPTMHFETALRV